MIYGKWLFRGNSAPAKGVFGVGMIYLEIYEMSLDFTRRLNGVFVFGLLALFVGSPAPADTVIVDNIDSGFTILSGTWDTGSYPTPYGDDYRWVATEAYDSGIDYSQVSWMPDLPVSGMYEVSVWYVQGTNRATDVEYTIHHAGGTTAVTVNQRVNGGQWNSLGSYYFNQGTNGCVTMDNDAGYAVVIADAVRFESSSATPVDLTMAASPAGWGTTTPAAGATYERYLGEEVSISAVPASGYEFSHWTVSAGDQVAGVNAQSTTVMMDVDKTVTAVFVEEQAVESEFRAFWADAFHSGFKSAAEIDIMIGWALAGNYNAIIPEVLAYQDNAGSGHGAYWNSSIVPKAQDIAGSFDPLAYLVQQAHANGLEVHPWLVSFRISTEWPPAGNSLVASHPEWLMVPQADMGDNDPPAQVGGKYTFDPGCPEVQEYLLSIVRELCSNYEIDGIHWDYIRYTQTDAGYPTDTSYSKSSLARFRAITGRTDTPNSSDSQWSDFRRVTIGEFVRRGMLEVQTAVNPRQPLRHTAALITWYPANSDFHQTRPYYDCFSDWEYWQSMGWLDATIPMAYFAEPNYYNTYRSWVDNCVTWATNYNRHTYIGPGIYLNSFSDTLGQIEYARSAGANGVSTYSYHGTNDTGATWSDWYSYIAGSAFSDTAQPPSMPWRDPSLAVEGSVYGIVTDADTGEPIDNATVLISGVQTVQTDGNGFYMLMRVPAVSGGSVHNVTAGYYGYSNRTVSATAYPAGATELNIILGGCDNDGDCDDGVYCNGQETCDALHQCQPGTAIDCDDEVACTIDSCNESTDSCDHLPDNAYCDNGVFCDGQETCDLALDCQAGASPCSGDTWCDEDDDTCVAYGDGDFDNDGDVDLNDFAGFQRCFGGYAIDECTPGDLTGTGGLIDIDDFTEFAALMTGP